VPPTRIFPTGDPSTITTYGTPQFDWDAMTDYQGVFAQSAARKAICFSSSNVTSTFNVALAWIDVPGLALVNDMDVLRGGAERDVPRGGRRPPPRTDSGTPSPRRS
jgi:hypothetical protein